MPRRTETRNPRRRHRGLPARRKTLARRHGHHSHEPHRHPGSTRRQGRRLDGKGQRRGLPRAADAGSGEPLMPHVSVKLYPGRSDADKTELARAITKNVTAILKCVEDSVSVVIEDVPPDAWMEQVYNPEITAKTDKL